ncbi:STAS domain-containing protein [Asanoa sp. NPDC050611]|uniref:STAS domain-containing protein n=1 Tax=Asanoa sp. NPDC050611 TaxID=3157098 RepID=UPI0033F87F2C
MARAVAKRTVLDDGSVVLDLHGELDIAVDDALRDILIHTITIQRPPRIIINMRRVAFVDSTGIGALVAGYNAAKEAGVKYEVRDLAPFIKEQLQATGVLALVAPDIEP